MKVQSSGKKTFFNLDIHQEKYVIFQLLRKAIFLTGLAKCGLVLAVFITKKSVLFTCVKNILQRLCQMSKVKNVKICEDDDGGDEMSKVSERTWDWHNFIPT